MEKSGAKDTAEGEEGFIIFANNQVGTYRRHHEAVVMPKERTGIRQRGRSQASLDTMVMGYADGMGPRVQCYGTRASWGEAIPHVSERCQPREDQLFPDRDPCRLGKCGPVTIGYDRSSVVFWCLRPEFSPKIASLIFFGALRATNRLLHKLCFGPPSRLLENSSVPLNSGVYILHMGTFFPQTLNLIWYIFPPLFEQKIKQHFSGGEKALNASRGLKHKAGLLLGLLGKGG